LVIASYWGEAVAGDSAARCWRETPRAVGRWPAASV